MNADIIEIQQLVFFIWLVRSEWSAYRYALDIDGNAHSFNRPLAIARAGCTLLRVSVFTDLFNEGLLDSLHSSSTRKK